MAMAVMRVVRGVRRVRVMAVCVMGVKRVMGRQGHVRRRSRGVRRGIRAHLHELVVIPASRMVNEVLAAHDHFSTHVPSPW
jgi:hypothetical protein